MLNRPEPLVLLILDGLGCASEQKSNAIAMADTPCGEQLQKYYPMALLNCSGQNVGLLDDKMGNSEIGHAHIGAGRYGRQGFTKVDGAIKEGGFFSNPVPCRAADPVIGKDKALHKVSGGSLSDMASTMPAILGISQPIEITSKSLLKAA